MKNIKIAVHYLLIFVILVAGIYGLFAGIAAFTMLDWKYTSIVEWESPFRLLYALVAVWVAGCLIFLAHGEWK